MKCIHCGTHSKLKDRRGGRCPKCRHRFAFEPTKDRYNVTDGQLKAAIDRVSGGSRVRFTERQLWHELNRRTWVWPGFRRSSYGCLPSLGLVLVVLVVMGGMGIPLSLPVIALVTGVVLKLGLLTFAFFSRDGGLRKPSRPRDIPFDEFRAKYLAKWRKVHGEIPLLLSPRETARLAAPREVPADVQMFSFDRAVVTEDWETADMLVANRFHFEHNCAVLSRDGYPDSIAETVKEMLRRNPSLTVFALHDASPGGCLLPLTLREPEWFPEPSVRIVDVGLRPGTVRKLKLPAIHVRGRVPRRLTDHLPEEDATWLREGNVAELAALRPARLMRALHRAIAAAAAAAAAGSSSDNGGGYGGDGGGGGVIWFGDLGGSGGGDTSTTDGFG